MFLGRLVLLGATTVFALRAPKPPHLQKVRGERAKTWTFEVLTRVPRGPRTPDAPVPDVEIVAVDKRGELGWFHVFRSKAHNRSHFVELRVGKG